MPDQPFSMLTAALTLTRAVHASLADSAAMASQASRTAQHSIILATAAEVSSTHPDHDSPHLMPLVRQSSRNVRAGSENLSSLIASVSSAATLAMLVSEAVEHAYAWTLHGTPIPGPAAAMPLSALWDAGATWDDEVVGVCGSFCSLTDRIAVSGADEAYGISVANLPPEVAHATTVCLKNNPHTSVADVRAAVVASLG